MTVRATWKAYELRCAKALGGRRIPVTGIDRAGADVVSDMFFYQVKLRKSIPSWTASDQGKVGVLVLRRPRQEDADALVVLRFSDWRDLHGEVRDRSGHT
jgi:hypothetical protein